MSNFTKNDDANGAYVLYVDHQGHPAPLTECFHATASRRLSSTVDRIHRPSTITQVDSAYCPQCLTYHDVVTASELGNYCPRVTCKLCPVCFAVATIKESDSKKKYYYYVCGSSNTNGTACWWNSKECLFGKSVEELDAKQRKLHTVVTSTGAITNKDANLAKPTDMKVGSSGSIILGQHYHNMIETWENEVIKRPNLMPKKKNSSDALSSSTAKGKKKPKSSIPPLPTSLTGSARSTSASSSARDILEGTWSLEALEDSLKNKKANIINNTTNNLNSIANKDNTIKLHRIKLDDDKAGHGGKEVSIIGESTVLDNSLEGQSVMSLLLSAVTTPAPPVISAAPHYYYQAPFPIPLRARKSRRCRAELAEGRPGILIKPKLNPLEGDSSLRTGHGQWWKKDSSAIHVIPRIKIMKTYHNPTKAITKFLLKVTNPTLGMIKLRLNAFSLYTGEETWDSEDKEIDVMTAAATNSMTTMMTTTTTRFENLLIDSITNKRVDSQLLLLPPNDNIDINMDPTVGTHATPTVELDSAEDAFVDLGKSKKMPEEVIQWIANKEKNEGDQEEEIKEVKIKLISPQEQDQSDVPKSSSGIAWFELTVPNKKSKGSSNLWNAVSIALQIQVGNGSWEASLIKSTTLTDPTGADWVTFDLVVTWPQEQQVQEQQE